MIGTKVEATTKPKTYQVPKSNHPWRQYANRPREVEVEVVIEHRELISVREFIEQLVEKDWSKLEVGLGRTFEGSSRHYLASLPQEKQAAWIIGILRRYYVNKEE